jgi:hypothetical protein
MTVYYKELQTCATFAGRNMKRLPNPLPDNPQDLKCLWLLTGEEIQPKRTE